MKGLWRTEPQPATCLQEYGPRGGQGLTVSQSWGLSDPDGNEVEAYVDADEKIL
ncbi:MAG: hypothetical protein VST68_08420 [Nitrospirota bacterium]|nr:hypothetical protein [Nitrospirota bacterium]